MTSHIVIHTVTTRCESVRTAVERVFGMLKKRFRILKLPLTGGDFQEIESMLFSCFIMHNMNLKDKARMDLGHMEDDWCDHAPVANRARRALYDIVNGRTLLFNKRAYTVADETDFSRLGCQISHHNFSIPVTLSCPGLHCGTISLVTLCIFLVTISVVNF